MPLTAQVLIRTTIITGCSHRFRPQVQVAQAVVVAQAFPVLVRAQAPAVVHQAFLVPVAAPQVFPAQVLAPVVALPVVLVVRAVRPVAPVVQVFHPVVLVVVLKALVAAPVHLFRVQVSWGLGAILHPPHPLAQFFTHQSQKMCLTPRATLDMFLTAASI
jgi:hypothetical protein